MSDPAIVKHINFEYTRLVDHNNTYHNQIKTYEALKMAQDNGLDLVCFNLPEPNVLALCKVVNYGKWKYEDDKRKKKEERERKKETKEVRFSAVISENDIAHKVKQVNEFLIEGLDVIISMKLKGREKVHFANAETKMLQIRDMCLENGKELSFKKDDSNITVRLGSIGKNSKKEIEKCTQVV